LAVLLRRTDRLGIDVGLHAILEPRAHAGLLLQPEGALHGVLSKIFLVRDRADAVLTDLFQQIAGEANGLVME
jgi:hypothetical protein